MRNESLENIYARLCLELNNLLLPSDLQEYHPSILRETLSLYHALDKQFYDDFPEREGVMKWLSNQLKNREGPPILELAPKIKKAQQIGVHYLPAFIACAMSENRITYYKDLFYSYKSLTMATVIHLILLGTHPKTPKEICDEMRQLANKDKRVDLLWLLPKIEKQCLLVLSEELKNQVKKAEDLRLFSVSGYLAIYKKSFESVVSGRDERVRAVSKKKQTNKISLFKKNIVDVESQGHNISEISEQFVGKRDASWQSEEKYSSPPDIKILNFGLSYGAKEPTFNYVHARSVSMRLALRKMKFPTQIEVLTKYALNILIKTCLNDIENPASQLVVLIIVTGLSPEQLIKVKFKKHKSQVSLYRKHKLPSYQQIPEFKEFLPEVKQKFRLVLPECIILPTVASITDAVCATRMLLSSLNKKYKLNLTMERLRLNLHAWLTKQSIDSAVAGALCGDSLKHQPGMYYTLIDESSLLKIYKEYISDVLTQEYASSLPASSKKNIGSNLPVLEQVIAERLYRIRICYKKTNDPLLKHYFLAIYTYYIMALFSGYRPVTAMLGYFQDINLITGYYIISDKENRSGIAARSIILPEIALQQLKIYKQSIKHFIEAYAYIYPDFCMRCRSALQSNNSSPWLFFEFEGEIVEPNPGELRIHLERFFPMPANWPRHWNRTCLKEFNLGQDITNGWIGHADFEQEGLGRYSGLTWADFKNVSSHFDRKAQEMGVITIDG